MMARTTGAMGKKDHGINIIVGIGVPKKAGKGLNPKTKPMTPTVPKAKGKSSTQGAKPFGGKNTTGGGMYGSY